ncbi:MAG: hypothetical protein ACK5QT_01395 [Oligoflexia bacterium]
MARRFFVLSLSVVFLTASASLASVALGASACSPAREYITFLEFAREHSEWKLPEKNARELARQVAENCPGSAGRVIRVTNLLSEAGVGSKDSLATGIRFSSQSDEVADRFVKFFKRFYLETALDLDIATAHRLAAALSVDYTGTLPALDHEFDALVRFCATHDELAQSRPRCARFAVELLNAAKDQEKGVADRFFRIYRFLVDDSSGPRVTTGQALVVSQQVAGASTLAVESFLESYKYAISKKGLGMSVFEGIEFSRTLVLNQLNRPQPQ